MRTRVGAPSVLIVDDEPLNRSFAAEVLSGAGWQVLDAADGPAALALVDDAAPTLILMDLHMNGLSGAATVALIRDRGDWAASTPIVAYTTTRLRDPAALLARGFDGVLAKPCTPAELVEAAARWWPDTAGESLDRLAAVFGAAEIGALTDRFRALLADALAASDDDVRLLAHRIAGIAGTLGFADVGQAWLSVSEGDDSAIGAARRQSRRALAAIDRRSRMSEKR